MPCGTYPVSTPYGARGEHWSCQRNAYGEGVHTGADFKAPAGTSVVACRPGTTAHVGYGDAFGEHQLAVRADGGGEDFYAHMTRRVGAGVRVKAGDWLGDVGQEGNATGPHLHLERHPVAGYWSCLNHENPQPSLDHLQETVMLDQATLDQIAGVVMSNVLAALRGDGVSGAADAVLMRQRWLEAGLIPATLNAGELSSVLRSEGVSGAADAALMVRRYADAGGMPIAAD